MTKKFLSKKTKVAEKALAYFQKATMLKTQGHMPEALENYQLALSCQADYAEAYYEIGNLYLTQGQPDLAIENYRQAVALKADFADAFCNLGMAFQEKNDLTQAVVNYRQALAINPKDIEVCCNLAEVFNAQGNLNGAVNYYQQAISLKPAADLAYAIYQRWAQALNTQGKWQEAATIFQQILQLNPFDDKAYYHLAMAFKNQKKLTEALVYFKKLLQLDSKRTEAFSEMVYTQLQCCDWSEYEANKQALADRLKAGEIGIHPFHYLTISSSVIEQMRCARICSENYAPAVTPLWTNQRYEHQKIRVAYISGDFCEHATSYLMAGLFEHHNKERFDIIALSLKPEEQSSMGQRVKAAFSQFIDVSKQSDEAVALLIRELEIDIAVDLAGFAQHCRPRVFAHRPAPVQVNYLGYPGTMGAEYMDYIVADRYVIPEEHQPFYSEKVVYLPDSYQVNDSKRAIANWKPSRTELGLPENGFVFCCFNNIYKIKPDIFTIWMRLLAQVEGSVLWLLEDTVIAANNLKKEAKLRGIAAERLIFAPRVPLAQHLARYQLADLFLDTLPYNAHTTTSDALWTGLPVVTCLGDAFAGRVAGSLLHAIGLPELISERLEDYEALALKLATSPDRLAEIRAKLTQNRTSYPLFDTDRFCKHIEAAYITMWERYQRGDAPVSFAVPSIK